MKPPGGNLPRTKPLARRKGLTSAPVPPGDVRLPRDGWRITREGGRARETKPKSAATGRGGMGQRKATPAGGFTDRVKRLIRERAGGGSVLDACCESCGVFLGEDGGEYSHRDARGMGGSRDPIINGPAGGTLACGSGSLRTGCHGACEDREDDMNALGFWLKNGQDPLTTPIQLHGRNGGSKTFYLAADGKGPDGTGYLTELPKDVAA